METKIIQMKTVKRSFLVILLLLVASTQSISAIEFLALGNDGSTQTEEGTCGVDKENLRWVFYPSTGVLEIVGSGAMADYGAHQAPWSHLEESISNVKLSPDITRIGDYAFFCCNVTSFDLPERLESIGYSAFDYTPWMQGQSNGPVYLDSWLITYIGDVPTTMFAIEEGTIGVADNALYKRGVKDIVFPKGLKYIGEAAFLSQPDLVSISFSEGLHSIGELAFGDCDKLISVNLPEGIAKIGYGAFSDCYALESIVLPGSLSSTGESAFASCPNLTNVLLSEGITRIDNSSFLSCTSLAGITLPNSLISIGSSSFYGTGITEIILPENVEKIEAAAFYGCPKLIKVTSLNRFPPEITMYSSFDVLGYDIDLYVPCRTFNDYKRNWNGFASITELECDCAKYKVTFTVYGEVVEVKEFSHDCEIELPNMKEVEGYTFTWRNVPDKMPDEDIIIYGEYVPNRYLITFKIDDEVIASDSLDYGTAIVAPEPPQKEGYTFDGWSEMIETVPAYDVTIEGGYSVNYYLLIYMVDGEVIQSDSVAYGAEIYLIDEPTKEGCTFSGWSEIPETMPASDVIISGTFAINQYIITYVIDGEVFATDTINYGESITIPEVPAREGYTFAWIDELPEIMPAKDIVINGAYTIITDVSHVVAKNEFLYIYTLDGKRVNKLRQGINIVLMKDGSVRKIFVK